MSEPKWQLDRRVPIVLMLTLLAQTGVALVWAGEAHERFVHLERQVERNAALNDRTVRVEERLSAVAESLTRIEAKLERASVCAAERK
jgi:hypothetical protein